MSKNNFPLKKVDCLYNSPNFLGWLKKNGKPLEIYLNFYMHHIYVILIFPPTVDSQGQYLLWLILFHILLKTNLSEYFEATIAVSSGKCIWINPMIQKKCIVFYHYEFMIKLKVNLFLSPLFSRRFWIIKSWNLIFSHLQKKFYTYCVS